MLHPYITNIQNKIETLKYIYDYVVWLIKQARLPREIGTTFTKRSRNHLIHYEITGHIPGNPPREVIEEIYREKL